MVVAGDCADSASSHDTTLTPGHEATGTGNEASFEASVQGAHHLRYSYTIVTAHFSTTMATNSPADRAPSAATARVGLSHSLWRADSSSTPPATSGGIFNGSFRAIEATPGPSDAASNTHSSPSPSSYDPFSGVNPESLVMTVSEQKACIMLSELFLDIDFPEFHYEWIARELLPLRDLSPIDLKRLLYNEVFPVVWTNLRVPAGEWAEFDHRWLLNWIKFRRNWKAWVLVFSPFFFIGQIEMSGYVDYCFGKVMGYLEEMKVATDSDKVDYEGASGQFKNMEDID